MRRILLSIAAAAAVLSVLWFSSPAYMATKAIEVKTVKVKQVDMYSRVSANGKIEQSVEKKIYAQAAMKITNVFVSEGESVFKGQTLFTAEKSDSSAYAAGKEELEAAAAMLGLGEEQVTSALSQYPGLSLKQNEDTQPEAFNGTIKSPLSGVVTDLSVHEGDIVPSGALCASVSDLTHLQVRTQIPESSAWRVKVGMPVNIEGEAFGNRIFTGYVTQIMPVAKQTSSLTSGSYSFVEGIVRIQNENTGLKPGYSADLWIFTSKRRGAVAVPYEAITQDENNRENVFVYSDGFVYKRYVQTGFELDELVEVSLGLGPGETVVLNPPEGLKHGQRVRAVSETGEDK